MSKGYIVPGVILGALIITGLILAVDSALEAPEMVSFEHWHSPDRWVSQGEDAEERTWRRKRVEMFWAPVGLTIAIVFVLMVMGAFKTNSGPVILLIPISLAVVTGLLGRFATEPHMFKIGRYNQDKAPGKYALVAVFALSVATIGLYPIIALGISSKS